MYETDEPRDFDAPKPCPYDASAGTIAAAGMLILFKVLRPIDPVAADNYLRRAFKLVKDTLGQCKTGKAILDGGNVNWGQGGWETILKHSTLNGNQFAMPAPRMDHGLVCESLWISSNAAQLTARCRLLPAPVCHRGVQAQASTKLGGLFLAPLL